MIPFEHLPFSPQLVQARWVLDKFPSEDAPGLAQGALENGYDGRNIRPLLDSFARFAAISCH
jgi:hypothetical protein